MTVKLNEEQTDRFSKVLFQNSNLAKTEEGERLKAIESRALHLEYPEAAMAGQDPTPHLGDGRRMNGAVRGRVESEKCWFEKTAKKFLTGGEKWL